MACRDLQKGFEGKDSAYMLVYRRIGDCTESVTICDSSISANEGLSQRDKVESTVDKRLTLDEANTTNINSSNTHSLYNRNPPDEWLRQTEEENSVLRLQRKAYFEQVRKEILIFRNLIVLRNHILNGVS